MLLTSPPPFFFFSSLSLSLSPPFLTCFRLNFYACFVLVNSFKGQLVGHISTSDWYEVVVWLMLFINIEDGGYSCTLVVCKAWLICVCAGVYNVFDTCLSTTIFLQFPPLPFSIFQNSEEKYSFLVWPFTSLKFWILIPQMEY